MSSSLLIILLVIVWLFVLAPMLIRTRNPIRRTGDALAQTRTLYSGGSRRLVPRRARAVGDPVVATEADEALFGLPSGEGSTDVDLVDAEDWSLTLEQTIRREAAGRRGAAVRRALEERRRSASEDDTTEIPVVAEDDGRGADEAGVGTAEGATPLRAGSSVVAGGSGAHAGVEDAVDDESAAGHEGPGERVAAAARPREEVRRPLVVDGELLEPGETRTDGAAQPDAAEVDAAGIDEEAELTQRGRRRHAHDERLELTEADIDFAERRRGRGAYDPMADRASAEQRYRARQRTTLMLAGLVLVSVLAAVVTVPAVWWFAGGAIMLLAAYLTYLRRQVKLEESLRLRRIERMRRARLGVESREDDELAVVPPRLRRPGAVVLEVDDEDPAFDVLEHAAFEDFPGEDAPARTAPPSRRAALRDPRDGGSRHDDRHLRRAVG